VRIEPKDFQENAVLRLTEEIELARHEIDLGRPQAVVLSSPTGSGKTVIMTLLMERLWAGHESIAADPKAVFLWMSDSPELNIQSKEKIEAASDVFPQSRLVIIDTDFDQERLSPGHVYFLNTQKLGVSSLLTKPGDGRAWTIWQTIENTTKASPTHFNLIVDEAHRGMGVSARAEANARTLIQRFIKGAPEVGLSPVLLVIGMSATPERFQRVLEGAQRITRPVEVKAEDVRESGLIKDRIILDIAEDDQPADWTLLRDAALRTAEYAEQWKRYCKAQSIAPAIEPVLVVQVGDGTQNTLTRTDLPKAVDVLERVFGHFADGELAHCFQEEGDITASGYAIRKIDASKIQGDGSLRVVFFKMALTTGWDCPRAEVMMSFRRAADHTLIAQLVGRMVRTPLARRVEDNEFLGSVALFLPHYDEDGLKAIVEKLEDPDTGSPVKVERKADLALYARAKDKDDLFDALAKAPTYVLDNTRRQANTRRLLSLARNLTIDGVDAEAWPDAKTLVVETLKAESARLCKNPEFAARVSGKAKINIKEFKVEFGELHELKESRTIAVEVTPENIDDLFSECETTFGEGLKDEYWRRTHDHANPDAAKLELFCVSKDPEAVRAVQDACGKRIDELFERYREIIEDEDMPSSRREQYARIGRQGAEPRAETIHAPELIEIRKETPLWDNHLFVDDAGKFGWKPANQWEDQVLREEMQGKAFAGWLRNIPKKRWAVCVPYGLGTPKPMYPDILVFRRDRGKIKIDIFDPHDDSRGDAAEKAVGLANFARKHGAAFGRIELIRVAKGRPERLRLHQESVRDKVMNVTDLKHLQELYASLG
jgi:type III restriction enzyme